jgi:hypothetical protein
MKKVFRLMMLVLIPVVAFIIFSGSEPVRAGPFDAINEDWTVTDECSEEYLSMQKALNVGLITGYQPSTIINSKMFQDKCVKEGMLGSLNFFSSTTLHYCPLGYTQPLLVKVDFDKDTIKGSKVDGYIKDKCCPRDYGYYYNEDSGFCCQSSDAKECILRDSSEWKWNPGRAAASIKDSSTECDQDFSGVCFKNEPAVYFFMKTSRVACSPLNCFWKYDKSNVIIPITGSRGPFDLFHVDPDAHCYATGTETADRKFTCFGSKMLDSALLAGLSDAARQNVLNTCGGFNDPGEQIACVNCYRDSENFVYNSLGCFDPSQTGLVIRVLQIGIGIISVVGIIRIMQAAFLRQTADPAKVQESWEIITSVVIGLVVMLASIILLRYIGINILQIVPVNFLS